MRLTNSDYASGPGPQSEGIVDALRAQQQWLAAVLAQAVQSKDSRRRAELAHAIRHHWDAHAAAEEAYVYWLLEDHVDTRRWVSAGRTEHAHIDRLIHPLFREDPGEEPWREAARELAAAFDEHTGTEERGLLPHLALLLDRDESRGLAELYMLRCTEGSGAAQAGSRRAPGVTARTSSEFGLV